MFKKGPAQSDLRHSVNISETFVFIKTLSDFRQCANTNIRQLMSPSAVYSSAVYDTHHSPHDWLIIYPFYILDIYGYQICSFL